jgi:hypothetical protein
MSLPHETNLDIQALLAIYPKDRKLTATERKEYTNRFLMSIHLDVSDHLPLIEDFTNVKIQEKYDIAGRAIILYALIAVAYDKRSSFQIIEYFKKYNLLDHVSSEELRYLNNPEKTKIENAQMSWRNETLNVLFWSLNKFDFLLFPDSICNLIIIIFYQD